MGPCPISTKTDSRLHPSTRGQIRSNGTVTAAIMGQTSSHWHWALQLMSSTMPIWVKSPTEGCSRLMGQALPSRHATLRGGASLSDLWAYSSPSMPVSFLNSALTNRRAPSHSRWRSSMASRQLRMRLSGSRPRRGQPTTRLPVLKKLGAAGRFL